MRFEVLTAMKMSILNILPGITPCGLVDRHQRFGGTYCCHLQGGNYFGLEDGNSMFLVSGGIDLQVHRVLLPTRPTLNYALFLFD
jgi:hypothetical protein